MSHPIGISNLYFHLYLNLSPLPSLPFSTLQIHHNPLASATANHFVGLANSFHSHWGKSITCADNSKCQFIWHKAWAVTCSGSALAVALALALCSIGQIGTATIVAASATCHMQQNFNCAWHSIFQSIEEKGRQADYLQLAEQRPREAMPCGHGNIIYIIIRV